jgi:hypothetical protein
MNKFILFFIFYYIARLFFLKKFVYRVNLIFQVYYTDEICIIYYIK